MNKQIYYLYKQADKGITDIPVLDTVKMENVPDGSLGSALQKRVEDNKKKLDADRKAKLKTSLQNLYSSKHMYL